MRTFTFNTSSGRHLHQLGLLRIVPITQSLAIIFSPDHKLFKQFFNAFLASVSFSLMRFLLYKWLMFILFIVLVIWWIPRIGIFITFPTGPGLVFPALIFIVWTFSTLMESTTIHTDRKSTRLNSSHTDIS